jgi:hypothetical protein
VSYFHPYQAEGLLRSKNLHFSEIGDFVNYPNVFTEYLTGNITFQVNGVNCKIVEPSMVLKDSYLIMTEGIEISYSILCPADMKNLTITPLFFNNFALQTNRLTLLGPDGNELLYKVATPKIPKITYIE